VTRPAATGMAWGLFGLFVLLLGLTGVLAAIAPPPPPGVEPVTADATIFSVGLLGIVAVGTLVAGRHPANPIGWLLCAFGLVQVVAPLCYLYAIVGFGARAQPLPGAAVAAWVSAWIWIPAIGVLGLALLLFPSGRLPSARWRSAAWAAIAGMGASLALGAALWPQRGPGLLTIGDQFPGVAGIFGNIALALTFGSFVAGAVSLIVRFLGSQGEERLQLKWLMLATGVAATGLIGFALADAGMEDDPLLVDLLSTFGILAIPVAMGIAIFKYRLYEIDRLISRTLSYALLTGVLVAVYAGSVLLLGPLLRPVAGSNDLAVAGSTLAVAALFAPARRRIQSFVDRRFNRGRYDAARMVEAFSARLRDQVDLDTLRLDLTATVRETLQPTHVSLWLREGGAR
jgi:hypothetical protein